MCRIEAHNIKCESEQVLVPSCTTPKHKKNTIHAPPPNTGDRLQLASGRIRSKFRNFNQKRIDNAEDDKARS